MDSLDFLESLEQNLILEKNKIKQKLKKENSQKLIVPIKTFSKLDYPKIVTYLDHFSSKELKSSLTVFKSLSFNQKNIFALSLEYNVSNFLSSPNHSFSLHSLERELWRIKKGMVPKNLIFHTGYATCKDTIHGFIRAFKENSIYSTKMDIDGKKTRVFVKTFVGQSKDPKQNIGFSSLILDPNTHTVYNLLNFDSKISLDFLSRFKITKKAHGIYSFKSKAEAKPFIPVLEKEMSSYVKRFKENTSFKKRHPPVKRVLKKSIFSNIKKIFIKK
jgi:hypothetical protein